MAIDGLKIEIEGARKELHNLKRLIEIRNEIKKRFHIWDEKKNVSSFIAEKLHVGNGKITLDEDIIGRFKSTEEAIEFLQLFAVIYGYTYNNKTNILDSNDHLEQNTESTKDEFKEDITEIEKERAIEMAREKFVTSIEDLIGFYTDESNSIDKIKTIFKFLEKKDEKLLFLNGNLLINFAKFDEKVLKKEIFEWIRKIKPEISIKINQEIMFGPEEQNNILKNILCQYIDTDIYPNINDSKRFLECYSKTHPNMSWEKSQMKYILTSNDPPFSN